MLQGQWRFCSFAHLNHSVLCKAVQPNARWNAQHPYRNSSTYGTFLKLTQYTADFVQVGRVWLTGLVFRYRLLQRTYFSGRVSGPPLLLLHGMEGTVPSTALQVVLGVGEAWQHKLLTALQDLQPFSRRSFCRCCPV